jgi:hypothetical protein
MILVLQIVRRRLHNYKNNWKEKNKHFKNLFGFCFVAWNSIIGQIYWENMRERKCGIFLKKINLEAQLGFLFYCLFPTITVGLWLRPQSSLVSGCD